LKNQFNHVELANFRLGRALPLGRGTRRGDKEESGRAFLGKEIIGLIVEMSGTWDQKGGGRRTKGRIWSRKGGRAYRQPGFSRVERGVSILILRNIWVKRRELRVFLRNGAEDRKGRSLNGEGPLGAHSPSQSRWQFIGREICR